MRTGKGNESAIYLYGLLDQIYFRFESRDWRDREDIIQCLDPDLKLSGPVHDGRFPGQRALAQRS